MVSVCGLGARCAYITSSVTTLFLLEVGVAILYVMTNSAPRDDQDGASGVNKLYATLLAVLVIYVMISRAIYNCIFAGRKQVKLE